MVVLLMFLVLIIMVSGLLCRGWLVKMFSCMKWWVGMVVFGKGELYFVSVVWWW